MFQLNSKDVPFIPFAEPFAIVGVVHFSLLLFFSSFSFILHTTLGQLAINTLTLANQLNNNFLLQYLCLPVSSADNLGKQFGTRSGPTISSGLIRVLTFLHSDGIPEIFFFPKR